MAEIELFSSPTPVETVAALMCEMLRGPRRRLGIAGGSVTKAVGVVRTLLGPAEWAQLSLTWVDERLVPESSDDSNRGAAYRSGALSKEMPARHELPLVLDEETGEAAVQRVSATFARDFDGVLDLALLGMGEDGHVASLFVGHRLLEETTHGFAWLDDSPKPPKGRVTMTRKILAHPELKRFVLATGEGKRPALQRLLAGDTTLPMARLGALTVVTDQTFSK